MNQIKVGDVRIHQFTVGPNDTATFEAGQVHPVCATFVLAREIEWASRLFVLEMKADNEEGIGTSLKINHVSPAMVGQTVTIEAKVKLMMKNIIVCQFMAKVGDRVIADGETGQKILPKIKLDELFAKMLAS